MGSSESDDRSDPKRSRHGSRASTAGPSRRASTGSSSRSPLSGPFQAPPLPAPPGSGPPAPSSQRPQQVTVETETVPTVPSVAVVSSAANGSLRVKRSQESVPRAPPSRATKKRSQRLTQGSKADIFAAKVANAVDEQDSSGSDETFVYDTTQPPSQQQPQSSQAPAAQSGTVSATASLAGDSMRRPYRRTGSTASVTGGSHTPLNQYDNGYFASLSSQPGYETEDYFMDGDDGQESYDGQTSPAPQWVAPLHSQQPQQPHHQSPRSFVVPKQSLVGRQRPPLSYINNAPPLPSQESSAESFGAYMDPNLVAPKDMRYRDPRDKKDPRSRSYQSRPSSRQVRNPSHSASYVDVEMPPDKDPNNSLRAKTSYLQRWRTPAYGTNSSLNNESPSEPPEEADERASLLRGRPSLYNYHARSTNGRRRLGNLGHPTSNASQAPRFGRDPERMSEYSRGDDSNFGKFSSHTPLGTKLIVGSVTILICLLSLAFVVGLLLAASQPLKDFGVVSLSDVFVSDKELVFSMILHARNQGIFATSISKGELDIFATSNFLDGDINAVVAQDKDKLKTRTVLLGTVRSLESPVTFQRRFWETASIKLVDPLANNTQQWSSISAHEFDLTVKGFLSYKVLGSEYRETVSNSYHVVAPGFMDQLHALL